jgi:hypothetical protein
MTVGLVMAVAMLALAMPAQALMLVDLNFDTNGVFPGVEDSALVYSGQRVEAEWFEVSGGLLRQRTNTKTFGDVSHPVTSNATAIYFKPSGHDPTKSLLIQARAAFFGGFGTTFGGATQVQDGATAFGFGFGSNGIYLTDAATTFTAVNDTNFHLYEVESPANSDSMTFSIDGVVQTTVLGATLTNTADINFFLADGSKTAHGADVDWDFVRIFQPVPEPATLGLMTIGGLMLLRRQRRA